MEQLLKMRHRAQELRKNATKEENHLWYDFLRKYPVQFRRQYTIDCFIVDFYCYKANLVIELDGSQHYAPDKVQYDHQRTAMLKEKGIKVLRFTNLDIKRNFYNVCQEIDREVKSRLA